MLELMNPNSHSRHLSWATIFSWTHGAAVKALATSESAVNYDRGVPKAAIAPEHCQQLFS